uniref:EF-hand domain-containing protein n=1 Tax=Arion vulgaris TaxID=1028688 RepID=A0A0B7ACY7_9EUPU
MFLYAILLVLPALIMSDDRGTTGLSEEEYVTQAFNYLDTNNNGTIDRTESEEAYNERFDTNNDGQITREEFDSEAREYLARRLTFDNPPQNKNIRKKQIW